MYKVLEVKENDFVKYMKSIFLVKKFTKLDNGKFRLEYYFRSIIKENARLYSNGSDIIFGYLAEKIKEPKLDEILFLKSRIKMKYPNFNYSTEKEYFKNKEIDNLSNWIGFKNNTLDFDYTNKIGTQSFYERLGSPNEFFATIGLISVSFQDLENEISNGIQKLLKLTDDERDIILSELSYNNKLNMFISIIIKQKETHYFNRLTGVVLRKII